MYRIKNQEITLLSLNINTLNLLYPFTVIFVLQFRDLVCKSHWTVLSDCIDNNISLPRKDPFLWRKHETPAL